MNSDSKAMKENPWLKELGYDIRDAAVKDAVIALNTNTAKKAKGSIERFQLRFRSRKRNQSESIYIRKEWLEQRENTMVLKWPGRKSHMKLFTGKNAWKPPEGEFEMDCRLQRTWTNDYYLCIPMPYGEELSVENQDQKNKGELRVCSLDPGVRTFQTIYDATNGEALQVGDRDMKRIFRLCKALDILLSKVAKAANAKKRFSYRRASRRLRRRIRNLVTEVHCQLAKHLARNYDLVMIPRFEVSQMVR